MYPIEPEELMKKFMERRKPQSYNLLGTNDRIHQFNRVVSRYGKSRDEVLDNWILKDTKENESNNFLKRRNKDIKQYITDLHHFKVSASQTNKTFDELLDLWIENHDIIQYNSSTKTFIQKEKLNCKNDLNKNKIYCNSCIKEGYIIDLKYFEINKIFGRCGRKSHSKNNITLRFNFKENVWENYMGYGQNAISLSESNIKSAIYTLSNKTGIFSKESHEKAVKSQIKNGTFNMLNSDFCRERAQKMIKNKTGIYSEENQKYIRSNEAGIKKAKTSNTKENAIKRYHTLKLNNAGIANKEVRG